MGWLLLFRSGDKSSAIADMPTFAGFIFDIFAMAAAVYEAADLGIVMHL